MVMIYDLEGNRQDVDVGKLKAMGLDLKDNSDFVQDFLILLLQVLTGVDKKKYLSPRVLNEISRLVGKKVIQNV